MLFSPLEQFQVNPIFDLNSCFVQYFSSIPVVLDMTLTPFGIFVLYILFIMFLQLFFYFSYAYFIPSRAQFIFEQIYMFVFGIVYKTSSKHKTNLFPFLTETLLVITLCNFLGLVPYTQTLTSTLIIPVFWSFAFNFSFFLWGCYLHGVYFLRNFSPKGVPLLLVPLMIVIEIMSYLIRPFSLALRLFANMMAGHALLHILASFVVIPIVFFALGLLLAPFPFFLVLFIYLLEVGIALLQAYVFVTLLAIYYNEAVSLH